MFRCSVACRAVAVLALFAAVASAQPQIDLQQAYLDLSNDGVAMDVSAHPDDEDGSSLAFYRMKFGIQTYSVLFTRGEGGQNEKGPELYEELGVLRSAETRAAGKILGTQVHFLNFKDFGYSKTATETFQKWGGSMETLRRLVYIIRKLKPDVIFTNHNTIDGHGNHQAAAITAIAAFDAAADSTIFPEQLKDPGIAVWQPRKLFFRAFGRAESTADVSNAINEVNPLRGVAYLDIASEALRQHRTQGMDRADLRRFSRGRSLYKLMRTNSLYDEDSTSFFSGIDFWRDPSIASLAFTRRQLSAWHAGMAADSVLLAASNILGRLDSLESSITLSPLGRRMINHWRTDIERIVSLSCGVKATLKLSDTIVVARQSVGCTLAVNSSSCTVGSVSAHFILPEGWKMNGKADGSSTQKFTLLVGASPVPTLPRAVAQYNSLERNQDVGARVSFLLNGKRVTQTVFASFDVAPAQLLTVTPAVAGILPSRAREGITFSYSLVDYQPRGISGSVNADPPRGWTAASSRFSIKAEDDTARGQITVHPPADIRPGEYSVRFNTGNAVVTIPVEVIDAKVAPHASVGIIESYDNTLEAACKELNVPFALVSDSAIAGGDLHHYTTIIVDIRAYLVRNALKQFNDKLLEYVKDGGNLVVMYQREQEWKPEYAPYPFQITRRRVTVEEAPVRMLAPDHPLLSTPNRITDSDWEGWKQERAVYFPGNVPGAYTQLLSSNDPDEAPLTTGYLVAGYGKGSYIYTSYVWYREMKEQNPGAFRCFANMISYPAYRR